MEHVANSGPHGVGAGPRLVHVRFRGPVQVDSLKAVFRTLEPYGDDRDLLLDLTDGAISHLSWETIRALAGYVPQCPAFRLGQRVALLAPKAVEFGTARIFASLADGTGPQFMVFRELDAALEWLQVDDERRVSGG